MSHLSASSVSKLEFPQSFPIIAMVEAFPPSPRVGLFRGWLPVELDWLHSRHTLGCGLHSCSGVCVVACSVVRPCSRRPAPSTPRVSLSPPSGQTVAPLPCAADERDRIVAFVPNARVLQRLLRQVNLVDLPPRTL